MSNPADSTASLLELRNISVVIRTEDGVRSVLQDFSLTVEKNEIIALVGESGSGKSICAQSILGILPKPAASITHGEILFKGQRIDNNSGALHEIRGKRIAMIFQEPVAALNPVQTVGSQISEVFQLHFPHLTDMEIKARSIDLLSKVGVENAAQRLQAYPHQLSGGLCQRVMIAMALACEPDVLIADEPSTALDVCTQQQLLLLLQDLQKTYQMSVIFITHDLSLVAQWCQRVAVLKDGYLCEVSNTAQLFSNPQHVYTKELLSAITESDPRDTHSENFPVLLSAHNLCKTFSAPKRFLQQRSPSQQVLRNISFSIHQGEILALVGESGCGKSTLGRALLFLDPPDSGEITYQGYTLLSRDRESLRLLRKDLQVIFQDTNESLNPRHTIGRILAEPMEIHGMGTAADRESRVLELLDKVELPADSIHRFPHEFSGGQRQRIGIARAIALNPRLIVCDEAVSALDVSTQAQIIALLLKLKDEMNLSLLFITHDLAVVRKIADRVLVMKAGEIVESGSSQQIFSAPRHEVTRQLLAASPVIPRHIRTQL